ncbi:hypothetical protein HMPREF1869_01359 [Bacteroidales bacterium KA00251]|nr:hypothetical protein HMPREF1869_01359 [Bacteroidales bacterium KA00251]
MKTYIISNVFYIEFYIEKCISKDENVRREDGKRYFVIKIFILSLQAVVRAKTHNSLKISRLSVSNESFQIPIIKRYNVTKEMIKVVSLRIKNDRDRSKVDFCPRIFMPHDLSAPSICYWGVHTVPLREEKTYEKMPLDSSLSSSSFSNRLPENVETTAPCRLEKLGKGGAMLLLLLLLLFVQSAAAQQVSVRTNSLYWASGTPNAGVEVKLHDQWSISLHGAYNPFLFRSWQDNEGNTYNPKLMHWTVMPEAKFWFCKTFERSYLGFHGIYGEFNVGGVRIIPALKNDRYWGNLLGVGLSYGYQLPLGRRGGIEFSVGAGWVRVNYNRCDAWVCGADLGSSHRNYFGPTKASITFCYFL